MQVREAMERRERELQEAMLAREREMCEAVLRREEELKVRPAPVCARLADGVQVKWDLREEEIRVAWERREGEVWAEVRAREEALRVREEEKGKKPLDDLKCAPALPLRAPLTTV